MEIEVEKFCPLGRKCEEVRDGKILRCEWLVVTGKIDDITDQFIPDTVSKSCAIPTLSVMISELKKGTRGVQAAVEDFRNVTVRLQVAQLPEDTKAKLIEGK